MQMPVTAYQYVGMVFETLPVYFDYAGKTWLIQIWKGQYGICTECEDDPLLRQQQRSIVIFVLLSALRRKTSDEASSYTRAKAVTGMGYHTAAVGCNQTKKNHCPMPPVNVIL